MRTTTALACSLLVVAAVSCSDDSSDDAPQAPGGSALETLPSAELTDWVNYGDAVVGLTVTAEEEIPPDQEQMERGEGYVARTVTVEVNEVLWEHPEAPSTPDTFDFMTIGWTMHDGQKLDAHNEGGERFEVGERYLVALNRRPDGIVAPVGSQAVLRIDGDERVVDAPDPDREPPEGVEPAEIELAGLTIDEVVAKVAGTERHPVAEANRDLDPEARAAEVQEADAATELEADG